jgi:choice-of-anchor B domain-containing protein
MEKGLGGYYRDIVRHAVLTMISRSTYLLASAALVLAATTSLADTEEPPLYVAPAGLDAGSCLEADAPCRSLDYALQRVGKNGRIRIAPGDYTLRTPANVFYLLSDAIDIEAEPGATLIGVPADFANDLGARGFRVIADSKGLDRQLAAELTATRTLLQANQQASACTDGFADGFPCSNVDLLSRVPDRSAAASGADIWGFFDLNTHREYAIMGYSTGTAIYDVTDPQDPREVGFIDGQRTTWRDIKVYQFWNAAERRFDAYAYVTADNASDGLFIIDLTGLPHRISRVAYPSDFREAHNVYMTKADFSTGLALTDDAPLLLVAGSNASDGRFRAYSLSDPRAPAFVAAPATPAGQPFDDRLYMHDGASMLITDARKDTQCVNAAGSPFCDVVLDFNESTLDIWDVTNPASPQRLSRTPYANAAYSHSGWWSEDRQYVFLQDELDERDRGLPTTLRVFSVADLRNPVPAGTWSGPTNAIDHNGFVRGNRYYMSNYARGLTILDITDASRPTAVGRFDSFPSSDITGFPGAWGTYPFLPSGNVLISDIDSGLYVVADRTLGVAEGSLSFAAQSFGAGEAETASIRVQRSGGSAGAVSVTWEIIPASGTSADVAATRGTLSWAPGDASERSISIPLVNDGATEGLERLMVRLSAPEGGATLSSPSIASLYVGDPGDAPSVGFADAEISTAERGFGAAVAVLHRTGSASGVVSVDFAVGGGDAMAGTDYSGPANGSVLWGDGDADPKTIEFSISDDATAEDDEYFELVLSNATGATINGGTLRINVLDGTGVNSAPNAVAGPNQSVNGGARVSLDGSASNDPDGDVLSYQWSQTFGPTVTLENADSATASFTAPTVQSDTMLRFQLAVTDSTGLRATSVTTVTVLAPDSSSGGGALSLWLLALLLFERMRLYDRLLAIRTRRNDVHRHAGQLLDT